MSTLSDMHIIYNIITGCGADGIYITNCSYITVENNVISNCNKKGFSVGGGIGLAYKDGVILPKQGKGISINNNICYDEQEFKTQKYGISVTNYGGSGVFAETHIVDNVIFDNSTSNFFISGNVFANNSNIFDDYWHTPSLLNSWVEFGGEYNGVGYYKDQTGKVYLKGFIKSGVSNAGTILFNLPVGYRPKARFSIVTLSNSGGNASACVVDISTNSNVQIRAFVTGNDWLALDSISFSTI